MINIKDLETTVDVYEIGFINNDIWFKTDIARVMHVKEEDCPLIITKALIKNNEFVLRVRFFVSLN
ncbi:MAG TPA: hypothetical protein PKW65_12260 [Bacteroidia bacterium]|nr:hypothetical protein [Bacteroidia bacterium]